MSKKKLESDKEFEQNGTKEESFLEKYNNDSRYKAKIQLIGWAIFVGILIVFVNLNSAFSNNSYIGLNNLDNVINEENKEKSSLISKLKINNYIFKIEVSKNQNNNEEKNVYDSKVFNSSRKITKTYNNVIEEYYIENNNYYLKNNETYSLVNSSNYFSFISETFMDLSTIINHINVGTLESTTNYNDGRVVKNYIIKLKDIVLNGSEDYITISVIEDNINNNLEFDVDYTNLYNVYDVNKLNSLKVKYSIIDFDKVEKFNDVIIK